MICHQACPDAASAVFTQGCSLHQAFADQAAAANLNVKAPPAGKAGALYISTVGPSKAGCPELNDPPLIA